MAHLPKLRLHHALKWVSINLPLNILRSHKYRIHSSSFYNVHRFFGSLGVDVEVDEDAGKSRRRYTSDVKRKVEGVLLDYLHCTRSLHFSDAEHISRNSPNFVKKLAGNVSHDTHEPDVRRCMSRYLNYHPINEFEPFFESIGLEPSEFGPLLPRDLMFLSDDDRLLDNYHVFCEYGIDRVKIGKIYQEAREVFGYDVGVLKSKLLAFEEVGIRKDVVARVVCGNPNVLVSGMTEEFFELVRKLKCLGCEDSCVEQALVETTSYNWRHVTQLLHFLHEMGCGDQDIMTLVGRLPGLLFDHAGRLTLLLMVFLLKFGVSKTDICSFILRFPQVKVEKFVWNLKRIFELLIRIEMDAGIIARIIREHFTWMGTCSLKKPVTILFYFNNRKKLMRQIIMADPMELKNWTLVAKVNRLPKITDEIPRRSEIEFLTSIGYTENSKEIEKALKLFHGRGSELPERFNCLVKAGISENQVFHMIKIAPQILNQSVDVLQAKISVLVNDLGYPLSSLRLFPEFLVYKMERVKLRYAMYWWLVDHNVVQSTLSLRTIIGYTEANFFKIVNRHPRGPHVWQEHKQIFSSM